MKTNELMNKIRNATPPEVKTQVDMQVAIANRIFELMEEQGMNQKLLAQKMNKTETEVSRWLSGTHNLTIATIAKLSVVLHDNIICTTHSFTMDTKDRIVADESDNDYR